MSKLNSFGAGDIDALLAYLEKCDTTYNAWDGQGTDPLPNDHELRETLERVYEAGKDLRRQEIWDEAYKKGHADGVRRIAREYGEIVRWR